MAGIYLHIPFCRKACTYCNFHFSTSMKTKERVLASISKEIELQKGYLEGATVSSIYFGGGTPSVLSTNEINDIIQQIKRFHKVKTDAEITLEANPDDLDQAYLKTLKQDTSINRLSIGIQSFAEADLRLMNRSHSAKQALSCLQNAKAIGFDNISIDLIYGTPGLSTNVWKENLNTIFELNIPHISCYALTVEENTALAYKISNNEIPELEDSHTEKHFNLLTAAMLQHGYEHYEISNFALPGMYAKHNTAYWKNRIYLGLGPSAHSFNNFSRQWNIANNVKYVKAIEGGKVPYTQEFLSETDRFNEAIMTGLRTMWGIDLAELGNKFDEKFRLHLQTEARLLIQKGHLEKKDGSLRITTEAKILADSVMSQLFYCE